MSRFGYFLESRGTECPSVSAEPQGVMGVLVGQCQMGHIRSVPVVGVRLVMLKGLLEHVRDHYVHNIAWGKPILVVVTEWLVG